MKTVIVLFHYLSFKRKDIEEMNGSGYRSFGELEEAIHSIANKNASSESMYWTTEDFVDSFNDDPHFLPNDTSNYWAACVYITE